METRNIRCEACGEFVPATRFCGECGATLEPSEPPTTIVLDETVDAGADGTDAPGDTERPNRRHIVIVAAVVVVLAVGGLGWWVSARDGEDTYTIDGLFSLIDPDEFLFDDEGDDCTGSGGYSDIEEGAQIRIRDGEGRSLGNASLGPGEIYGPGVCDFAWTAEVPRSAFYRIEMGRRGELEYTFEEMVEKDWSINPSVGSWDD